MNYGICCLSCAPLREEPKPESAMGTQLLFGDLYEVLEQGSVYQKVRLEYDGYEGWLSAEHGAALEAFVQRLHNQDGDRDRDAHHHENYGHDWQEHRNLIMKFHFPPPETNSFDVQAAAPGSGTFEALHSLEE